MGDDLAIAPNGAREQVHADRSVLQFPAVRVGGRRNPLATGAAEDGIDAGHQLAHVEGLGQIVVGANFQTHDAVDVFAARREHNDGHIGFATQAPKHFESVHAGQIHIQQDEIQAGVSGLFDALLSGVDGAEFEPFLRERLAEQLGHLAIIVDDQYFPHSASIRPIRAICQFPGRGLPVCWHRHVRLSAVN
jgi:hypothetical protein